MQPANSSFVKELDVKLEQPRAYTRTLLHKGSVDMCELLIIVRHTIKSFPIIS